MLAFALRRVAYSLVVILGVVFFLAILAKLVPGDAVDVMVADNPGFTQADVERLREQLGLNYGAVEQFVRYTYGLLHGDMGESLRFRRPVWDLLQERLPATIELTVLSMILAVLVAFPIGMAAALKRGSLIDYGGTVFSVLGVAIPGFLIGILLILLFSVELAWLPPAGRRQPLLDATFLAIQTGSFAVFWDSARYILMPAVSLAVTVAAINARLIRSTVLETMRQDFVVFAKSKGLTRRRVNIRHVLRNALIPTVTIIGLQIGNLISGAFIIENVFAWPGLGRLAVEAINTRDFPLIQGTVLLAAVLYLTLSLIVDLLYCVLDPRVNYGSR